MQARNKFYAQLRQSAGTRKEVAALLGIHPKTVERRELGRTQITDEMVAALEFFKSKEKK